LEAAWKQFGLPYHGEGTSRRLVRLSVGQFRRRLSIARYRNGLALCDSQIAAAGSFEMDMTKPPNSTM
ncbi:hypothetical protein, partial [Ellagibacter isourolithinifaciens]|uniref:hypothetical protein n=1 Tax=Ellagibacter isourolithinifaciens TaxID=2137581 RepID=UPI003A9535BB